MARRKNSPPTPKQIAEYEAAGQQCFQGIPPLRTRRLVVKRATTQALAVTRDAVRIVQDLPAEIAASEAQPPLMPGVLRAPRSLSLVELTLLFAPWLVMAVIVCIVVFRADATEISYAVRIIGVPRRVMVGFLGCLATGLGVINAVIILLWATAAIRPSEKRLATIARHVVIVAILIGTQIPTFISLTQSREASVYVLKSVYRAVLNEMILGPFSDPVVKPERSR